MKLSFIGLGKLGLPCAEVFAENGYSVKGYDIQNISSKLIKIESTIRKAVSNVDIVFISVPTPHDPEYDGRKPISHLPPKDFDYSIVKNVIQEANQYMNSNQILVLISTVLPGTVREQLIQYVTNPKFVYNPYFIAMGSVKYDMVNPDLIILGSETGEKTEEVNTLISLYKSVIENDAPIVVSNWDECECIKVFYNTLISTKLSFVNMIQDVAEKQGNINVDIVTEALCKSTDRIISSKYMKAGMGDGGACHPRDNIALKYLSQKLDLGYDFFGAIMHTREMQARNVAIKLVNLAKENNMPVVIHGKAYKPDVPYIDGSYSILIGTYCEELGILPKYIDPLVENNTITEPSVILLAHSSLTTYFKEDKLYCDIPEKSIVVDMWRNFKTDKNIQVIPYGNART
jgi:UDPglucose 6-dehydrogenase